MLSKLFKGPLATEPSQAIVPESVQRQIQVPEPYAGVTPREVPARTIEQLQTAAPEMVRPAPGPTGIRPPDVAPIEAAPTETSPPAVPRAGIEQFDPNAPIDLLSGEFSQIPGSNVNTVPFNPEEVRSMAEAESLRLAEPTIAPDFSSPDIAFENITKART